MLFGSQFLREVYDEGSSLSTVIDKQGGRMQTMPDDAKDELTEMIMNKLGAQYTQGGAEESRSMKY